MKLNSMSEYQEYPESAPILKPAFSTHSIITASFAALILFLLLTAPLWLPGFVGSTQWARGAATRHTIAKIERALSAFERDAGRCPSQAEGLWALLEKPAALPQNFWKGPYLEAWPKDSWGDDFIYRFPSAQVGRKFDIISAGGGKKSATKEALAKFQ